MATGSEKRTGHDGRQVVGFSLPPSLAREVKQEGARRNLSLRNLFQEMWDLYKKYNTE